MPTDRRSDPGQRTPRWDHSQMPPDEPVVQQLTLAMAAVMALLVEIAIAQPSPLRPGNALAIVLAVIAASLAHRLYTRPGRWRYSIGGALLLGVLLVDPARLLLQAEPLPTELLVIGSLRDLGLVLAALGGKPVLLRCAGGICTILVLAAACLLEGFFGLALLALFTVIAGVWLCLLYWGQVRRELLPGKSRRLPVVSGLAVWVVLMALLAVLAVGPRRALAVLAELVHTSGGTSRYDSSARGGVNDGDAATNGTNAPESTGLVESDIFLESNDRTLYDAADQQYGKPKARQDQQRAMALTGVQVRHPKRQTRNQKAAVSFPMNRSRPTNPGRPRPQRSDARIFIDGPAPAHLRLLAYDTIAVGRPGGELPGPSTLPLEVEAHWTGWLNLPPASVDFLGSKVRHSIKMAKLESARLLTPPQLTGFKLERIQRPDFFAWAQDGILCLADGWVPAGTILEVESRPPDRDRLRRVPFPARTLAMPWHLDVKDLDPRTAELARAWAGDEPRGWTQVEKIIERLRTDYQHDNAAVAPDDCDDPLAHFLFESRVGPDYLFASAAMVLLRHLGHPARVVWGFYVNPEHYDPETRHINGMEEDLHFWTEVLVPGDEWIVVEPTPGYEVAAVARPWQERALASLRALGRWARERWPVLTGLGLLLLLAVWRRRDLADLAVRIWWRSQLSGPARRAVLATLQVLESRARWAGRPRPCGLTPRAWYGRLAAASNDAGLTQFLDAVEWAAYAPEQHDYRTDGIELRRRCRQVIAAWNLRRLRRERSENLHEASLS